MRPFTDDGTATAWMEEAECRGKPSHLWFPERGGRTNAEVDIARDTCRACPVRVECLEFAVRNHITEGMWGGLSVRERRRFVRARRLRRIADVIEQTGT